MQYRDWVWDAFVAINTTCRTDSGFSGITNVNAADGGSKDDNQESFLFAEVMKYAYLVHAPGELRRNVSSSILLLTEAEDEWQVQSSGNNAWVFNTEAHPLQVANPGL